MEMAQCLFAIHISLLWSTIKLTIRREKTKQYIKQIIEFYSEHHCDHFKKKNLLFFFHRRRSRHHHNLSAALKAASSGYKYLPKKNVFHLQSWIENYSTVAMTRGRYNDNRAPTIIMVSDDDETKWKWQMIKTRQMEYCVPMYNVPYIR